MADTSELVAVEFTDCEEARTELKSGTYNDRTTICDSCGKSFINIYTLAAHKQQVHEGVKRFRCNICSTSFVTRYKLQRHNLGVHSDKRDQMCQLCNSTFKTRDMLLKHQRSHFQAFGPFNCTECDGIFKFKSGLDYHMKLKHSKQDAKASAGKGLFKTYDCPFCKKKFKYLHLLERHEEYHLFEEEKIECRTAGCHEVFNSANEYSKHTKSKHKEAVVYNCNYCQKIYKSKSNFEIHIAAHENENEMRDYVYMIEESQDGMGEVVVNDYLSEGEKAEDDPEELLKRIDKDIVSIVRVETIVEPEEKAMEDFEEVIEEFEPEETINEPSDDADYFVEEIEDYLIESGDGMQFYEELESPNYIVDTVGFEKEESADCETQFVEIKDEKVPTKKKEKSFSSDNQIVCEECGSTFKNNSHLKRHIMRKHRKEDHKLECDVCGLKFLLNYDLKRHMIKHSSIREYSCESCGQRFKTEVSLKSHVKVLHNRHENPEKRFHCKFNCGRSYLHERHLNYHQRKHTNDQRFKCSICEPEKMFFYSDAVKWHLIRTHNEPAPYVCYCGKKFIHEKTFQSHQKDHQPDTGSLAVQCRICGKSVSEKRHMKRHMRSHIAKEFMCSCGEAFKERHQLTKHSLACAASMTIVEDD